MRYDVVIIGAGIAGLYAALNISSKKKVLIINKEHPWECNTFYAQGGVTTAVDDEDIELHIRDTMLAGAGLCNAEAVRVLSENSQKAIRDLIDRGFEFDKDDEGKLLYTKEAAHSRDRILHAGGDATGRYLHQFLLEKNEHPMLSGAHVVDLLIEEDHCCGVSVFHDGQFKNILADTTIIASGGIGSLYEYHTNAFSISADIQGIALTHNITLENMEMTQFHPTVYVANNGAQKQLLSEALRGEGAKVVDENGYRFLPDYHKDAELAPRDIVSRALFDYNQKTGLKTYLSFDDFDAKYFQHRFPNIFKSLHDLGFELPDEKVPVSPAFHYAIGGIKTDLNGKVPNIENLYAIGEVASTGVHGANRLASNSLLEGLVFALRSAEDIKKSKNKICRDKFETFSKVLKFENDKEKKSALRSIMWQNVSIQRRTVGLQETLKKIDAMLDEEIGWLLQLRLLSAKSIVEGALARTESVGVHYLVKD